jgi:response regulator RpfG family c-di-GMP phosphodiesterase
MARVLAIDDESAILRLVARWVEGMGHVAALAGSAEQALDRMAEDPASVAICDVEMPGRDGIWLAEQLRARYPETALVMITGSQSLEPAIQSLRLGAIDYLLKPFNRARFHEAVTRGIQWHQWSIETRRDRRMLESDARSRHVLLQAPEEGVIQPHAALEAILALLRLRDPAAYDHGQRVGRLAVAVATRLGVVEPLLSRIERAALLHDLGKIAVPDALLHKPERLTPQERALLRQHPQLAHDVLAAVTSLADTADLVLSVHERYDGSGYPRGLRGDDIPLGSRIIAAAEALDAMTHPRSFAAPLSLSEALLEVSRCCESQFAPAVVTALMAVAVTHTKAP